MREKVKEGKELEIRPYNNSLEHMLDLLSRLDFLLAIRIIKFQKLHYRPHKQNYGLVITNEEVNAALNINTTTTTTSDLINAVDDNDEGSQIANLKVKLVEKEKEIASKVTETLRQGIYLSLPHLIDIFKLTQIEVDAILICLATQIDNEINKKYQKLYAYLNDNIMQKKPTVDLVLSIIYESLNDRVMARTMMSKDTRLFRYRILEFVENDDNYDVSDRPIRIDEQIANFLLGSRIFEPRISSFAKLSEASVFKQEIAYHHQDIINDIASLLLRVKEHDDRSRNSSMIINNDGNSDQNIIANSKIILNLFGPRGSGRKTVATIICRNLQYPMLYIDLAEILSRGLPLEEYLLLAFREALLFRAAIYLENFDLLLDKNEKSYSAIKTILRMIDELSWLTFIETTPSSWNHGSSLNSYFFRNIEFKIPSYKARKRVWESVVDYEIKRSNFRLEQNVDFGILASKFPFTPGRIRDSFQVAKNLAISRSVSTEGVKIITMNDLYQGCKVQSDVGLGIMAKKIQPNYGWTDIVLPPAIMVLLKDICNVVKYKGIVYYEWGFDAKFSLGKGLTALFTGESGTGKTMAAEVISKDLDLDLYKIDISSILSKYIGETEKNLNTIFRESEGSNSILFFDEADALFGKRTEVKDSHDRYANIETNYLLQKIDEFDGIVILSSNFRRNIDESFLRRMQFIVNFPFPDAHHRLEIWNKAFPQQVPRSNDLDLKFLADNLQISGGNIKNVVVNSAFLAAKKNEPVSMSHIVLAIKREFEKMGRPIQRSDFGKYSVMLDPPFAT
jgi:ATPase family associated with various cellular activities (AAA)